MLQEESTYTIRSGPKASAIMAEVLSDISKVLRVDVKAPLYPMPEIPVGKNHPGAFGIDRHKHVHTGIDLYSPYGCPVHAIEAGKIISIEWFTGPKIGMPWWNDTRAVYIEGKTGVFNYGEIQELPHLKVGDTVAQGDPIGYVLTVLRRYKGRPMSMLHLELYDHGYKDDWGEWKIGDPKPEHLKDPTPIMLTIPGIHAITEDPYLESVRLFNLTKESHESKNERGCC